MKNTLKHVSLHVKASIEYQTVLIAALYIPPNVNYFALFSSILKDRQGISEFSKIKFKNIVSYVFEVEESENGYKKFT